MAGNKVDAIFASEAIAQIIKVKDELALVNAELIKVSQDAAKASASVRNISSPSGLDKMVSDSSQLNEVIERQSVTIKGLTAQIEALKKARATNNKLTAEEIVQRRITSQNAIQEAKLISDRERNQTQVAVANIYADNKTQSDQIKETNANLRKAAEIEAKIHENVQKNKNKNVLNDN